MRLKVTGHESAGVTILHFSGRIDLGQETALMRDTILDLITRGRRALVLDLSGVSHIDSTGIGELVSVAQTIRQKGGDLKLLNLTKKLRDMVEVVRLGSIFELFEDEAAAVNSFPPEQKKDQRQEPGPAARAS
jgi:anti-sigma B factor antagonist